MKKLFLIVGLFLLVLSVPILSEATPIITIENPGFTCPDGLDPGDVQWSSIPGWPYTVGNVGILNPSSGIGDYCVGFANLNSSFAQELDYLLETETTLTLSVGVGWQSEYFDMPSYDVRLMVGDHLLDSESSTSLSAGMLVPVGLSYEVTTDDVSSYYGQNIKIVLCNTAGTQVLFDDVSLTHDYVPVPEPSIMLLLGSGLLGLSYFIRRKKA